AIQGLSPQQIETPYREGGWTVRQVVHHVPESHMNAYIRFKLALTEDEPTIKPYMEDRWAQLPDCQSTPLEVSLALLESLHDRFVRVLRSMKPEEWKRTFKHPELGLMPLKRTLHSIPGTDAITWRTLPNCENQWAGKSYTYEGKTGLKVKAIGRLAPQME